MRSRNVQLSARHKWYYALLLMLVALLSWVALMLPLRDQLRPSAPVVGDVADQDYSASRNISFTSLVLTEQKQTEVERSVSAIYTPPDPNVARRSSERLRAALAFIDSVRADGYSSEQQKREDLAALDEVSLSPEAQATILSLADSRWQAVEQGSSLALERAMGGSIRAETLEESRQRVPSLVSFSLSEAEADVAAELVAAFVQPNSFFDEAATQKARQAARSTVSPVTRSYASGQTVVSRGQVLNAADVEALQELGLIATPLRWEDLLGAAALAVLMVAFIALYLIRDQTLLGKPRRLTLLACLFLVYLISVRLIIPFHTLIPYAFPLSAFGLTVVALFGSQFAMVTALPLAIMAAYALPNALDLTMFYLIGGLMGILALGRGQRVSLFFWAGATVAATGALVILAYRLIITGTDWLGVLTLMGVSVFNGLATASLTILSQFLLSQLLGMTTPMQLMELTRPDHPLMQKILRQAPGTYQHSLQVANLAEQAAERIGADPLLTRVGALYHDAGKSVTPAYFIENQPVGGLNPHQDLDPLASAQMIISHVPNGLEIARKHRLPRRVMEFISEHHGTSLARYQYVNAVKACGGDEDLVDAELFRYPGPRPQSRETAILMLADGSEARVRAEKPQDEEGLRQVVKAVFDERIDSGQLDDTHLTMQDLSGILESFVATLRGMYHPRILYPQLEKAANLDIITRPSQPALTRKAPDKESQPDIQSTSSQTTP